MRSLRFLTLFFFLTTMVLVYQFVIAGSVQENYDGRTAVNVTENEDIYIRQAMNQYLISLNQIVLGIENEKYNDVEAAAKSTGRYLREHAPAGLVGKVPLRFKSLGFDTMNRFDELAKAAKEKKSSKDLLSQMSGIIRNCTACHSSYTFNTVSP